MISDSKKRNFTVVFVHKLDRFARDRYCSIDSKQKLKLNGVIVFSVVEQIGEKPQDIMMISFLEGYAEFYSKNLAFETMKGLKENALKGKHTGGIPPLGYDLSPDTKELIINPIEAEAVKLIFQRYNEGYGYGKIISELNTLGYKTKRGNNFGKNSLHDILKNEKYTGTLIFNKCESRRPDNKINNHKYKPKSEWIMVEDLIPVIVSKELFESIQIKMKENQRTKARHTAKETYLLSCKIRCGLCNSRFTGINRHAKPGREINYVSYRCSKHNGSISCTNSEIRRESLELLVLDKLATYLFSEQILDKLLSEYTKYSYVQRDSAKEHINRLLPKYEKTKQDIDTLIELMLESKSLSLNNKLEQLEEQKNLLEEKLSGYEQQIKHRVVMPQTFKQAFYEAKRRLSTGDLSSIRLLIDTYVNQIIVYPDRIEIEFFSGLGDNAHKKNTHRGFSVNSLKPAVYLNSKNKKVDTVNGIDTINV